MHSMRWIVGEAWIHLLQTHLGFACGKSQMATAEPCWTGESQGRKSPDCRADGQAVLCTCLSSVQIKQVIAGLIAELKSQLLVNTLGETAPSSTWVPLTGRGSESLQGHSEYPVMFSVLRWKQKFKQEACHRKVFDGYQFVTLTCPPFPRRDTPSRIHSSHDIRSGMVGCLIILPLAGRSRGVVRILMQFQSKDLEHFRSLCYADRAKSIPIPET
jgi:hypothetical protein